MGRQVVAKLSDEQEQAMLDFLRQSADVALIRAAAPTADGLFTQQFSPRGDWHWIYYLWNREHPWTPQIIEHRDHVSIGNTATAPLIEYTRHNFGGAEPTGRIYWAKDFSAPDSLDYDAASFSRWFDSVAGWLRRHGRAP